MVLVLNVSTTATITKTEKNTKHKTLSTDWTDKHSGDRDRGRPCPTSIYVTNVSFYT